MKKQTKGIFGFTLVETLVAISVISVLGVLIILIFSRALRGDNKAQVLLAIKQNGQSSLEKIDKTIRNADQVVCVSNNPNNSLVVAQNGLYTRYRFVSPTNLANGFILQDNPIPSETETDPKVFVNRICNPFDPISQGLVLTDTNPTTGVSVQNGTFTRDKLPGFRDVVIINFDVSPPLQVIGGTLSSIEPANFKTTIQLR